MILFKVSRHVFNPAVADPRQCVSTSAGGHPESGCATRGQAVQGPSRRAQPRRDGTLEHAPPTRQPRGAAGQLRAALAGRTHAPSRSCSRPRGGRPPRVQADDDLVQASEDLVQPSTDRVGDPRGSDVVDSRCLDGSDLRVQPVEDLVQPGGVERSARLGSGRGFQFEARICNPLVSALVGGRGPHAHAEAQLHRPR